MVVLLMGHGADPSSFDGEGKILYVLCYYYLYFYSQSISNRLFCLMNNIRLREVA